MLGNEDNPQIEQQGHVLIDEQSLLDAFARANLNGPKIPVIHPPDFKDEEDDIVVRLKAYETTARAQKWFEETKLQRLPLYLKSHALNWYYRHHSGNENEQYT